MKDCESHSSEEGCECGECKRVRTIIGRIMNAIEYVEREFALSRAESLGYLALAQKLLLDLSISLPQEYA
jgi:hypothetical protein